jgi:RNA polymerase sigma factor (sigma-70 family)
MQTEPSSQALEVPDDLPEDLRRRLPSLDPEALEAFFDLYFPRLYGYVRGLVRHEQLAEDLTQDIFVQLHRGLSTYDPDRALRPWVFTVAVNRVRDYWRSRRHRESQQETSTQFEDDAMDLEAPSGYAPELPLEALEDAHAVREAVERLPAGMREVVVMRVFEDMSFGEIGEVLGRNEVAVRKRYSRALGELRRLLGVDPDDVTTTEL